MEVANQQTVLGNFHHATFAYAGSTTRFSTKDGKFYVTTFNEQGKPETFAVAYTLGYKPLQQYLVTFPDGRIQVLPFAWDTRDKKSGGQRWFHLYPNEKISPENPLFWTRPLQNWNHMCGDCHTTDFSKHFSDEKNTFASHWSELANGCESCHGPGSAHLALVQQLKGKLPENLQINRVATQREQIDRCGVCHARRSRLKEDSAHEQMLQTWQPELLHEGLYQADGEMQDEVFNIGSFMQSKMYAHGVMCTTCHNPHDGKLKFEGNAVCTQCHVKETYDSAIHRSALPDSKETQCAACHMPVHTYMVIDKRHDHSFVVSKTKPSAATKTYADTLAQLRQEHTGAAESFAALMKRDDVTAIRKATALTESASVLGASTLALVAEQLKSSDALLRLAAVNALAAVPPEQRNSLLLPMMNDNSRAVRFALASLLAGADKTAWPTAQRTQLDALVAEYRQALLDDADRGTALVNLASLALAQGDVLTAQQWFEKALQRDEKSLPALLNYADYWRSVGNDAEASKLLRRALEIYPDSADAHYAQGLLLVRQKQIAAALVALKKAQQLAPQNSQYSYVYGVGLYSSGDTDRALAWLADSLKQFPANPQIRSALLSYCAEQQYNARLHHQYCEKLP